MANENLVKSATAICGLIISIVCIIVIILYETTIPTTQSYTNELSPVVNTTKGQVQGCILSTKNNVTYFSYKGIRYAKAPVGQDRFKPPYEVESWTGVLKAYTEGSSCPQIHPIYKYYTGNEDCLYLNVYTQKLNQSRPVMVWIHGGSYKSGSGNQSFYGPDCFIENNIVVVTFNYRLGALGFLALLHSNATGNAGLKDQNAALKWVQQNIANFGGDPQKVTIIGQSAGSISTCLHALSPMSKGLFRSLITMSGTPLNPLGLYCLKEAEKRAFELGSRVGCKTRNRTELRNCLCTIEPQDLVNATIGMRILDAPFKPTVEDTSLAPTDKIFLSECPMKIYNSGKFSKLPQMIGYTKNELLTILADFDKQWRDIGSSIFLELLNKLSDILVIAGIETMQRISGKNYYYILTFDSPYSVHQAINDIHTSIPEATHEDDNGYLFNMDEKFYRYIPQYATKLDYEEYTAFRCKMCKLWANFVIYNDPTPNGTNDPLLNVKWLPAGPAGRQLDLNKNFVMKPRQASLLAQSVERSVYYFGDSISGCNTTLCTILELP